AKRSFVACEQCVTIASREFLSLKPGATTMAISSMASKAASTEAMSGGFFPPDVVVVAVVPVVPPDPVAPDVVVVPVVPVAPVVPVVVPVVPVAPVAPVAPVVLV